MSMSGLVIHGSSPRLALASRKNACIGFLDNKSGTIIVDALKLFG
jgi:hypothetical protein